MSTKKYVLYGLGSGIIAGAVLLQLMLASPSSGFDASQGAQQGQPTAEALDKEELRKAASVHFNVYEKDAKVYTQPELDAVVVKRVEEEKAKNASAAQTPAAPPVRETYVYVTKGMVMAQVSEMLFQSGLISDQAAFENEMHKRQLSGSVIAGIHVFKGPQSLEQIITNLISR
ncbi:hypothetical protein [Paenibacillus sp. YYML68]|uniref:hypothetical protein n=1 Tax=Paenibacillus sp. YYML68 TaxID=2909250 RepID=UPI00248FE9F6|nr:hypothetical protein [Paenibacillus sp. YYML68]